MHQTVWHATKRCLSCFFLFSSLGLSHTCQTDNELVSRCCREQTYCVQPSTTTTTITLTGLMPLSSEQMLRKLFSTSYVLKKEILNLFFWIVGARKGRNVQVFVPLWSQHSKLEWLKPHRNNPLMLQILFYTAQRKKKITWKDHKFNFLFLYLKPFICRGDCDVWISLHASFDYNVLNFLLVHRLHSHTLEEMLIFLTIFNFTSLSPPLLQTSLAHWAQVSL